MFQKLFKGNVLHIIHEWGMIGRKWDQVYRMTCVIPSLNNRIIEVIQTENYRPRKDDTTYDTEEDVIIVRDWSWFRFKYKVIGLAKNLSHIDKDLMV